MPQSNETNCVVVHRNRDSVNFEGVLFVGAASMLHLRKGAVLSDGIKHLEERENSLEIRSKLGEAFAKYSHWGRPHLINLIDSSLSFFKANVNLLSAYISCPRSLDHDRYHWPLPSSLHYFKSHLDNLSHVVGIPTDQEETTEGAALMGFRPRSVFRDALAQLSEAPRSTVRHVGGTQMGRPESNASVPTKGNTHGS